MHPTRPPAQGTAQKTLPEQRRTRQATARSIARFCIHDALSTQQQAAAARSTPPSRCYCRLSGALLHFASRAETRRLSKSRSKGLRQACSKERFWWLARFAFMGVHWSAEVNIAAKPISGFFERTQLLQKSLEEHSCAASRRLCALLLQLAAALSAHHECRIVLLSAQLLGDFSLLPGVLMSSSCVQGRVGCVFSNLDGGVRSAAVAYVL